MNSNNTPVKLFVTGTTGYIGGAFLSKILEPSHQGKYDITVLTRSEDTIPKFKALGVKPLLGSLDSAELLTQAAIDADVVLNFAHADHMPAAQALIKGLQAKDGKKRIYIHTSGTGVLADRALGNSPSDKIYNDLDIETIHALPITQPHKDVDSYIFENNQGFDSIIVAPPTIYGLSTGPFNRQSHQIPTLIRTFLKAGKASTIGKSANIWSYVHIDDLANLYILLLEKALKGEASTGHDGWYFCETGEYVWSDAVAKISEELYKKKAISDPTIGEYTSEEAIATFGDATWYAFGSNSRSRANRARQLGWKPDDRNSKLLDAIEAEVKAILEAQTK